VTRTADTTSLQYAPAYFEKMRRLRRSNSDSLVAEITFALYLCEATRKRASVETVAAQANATYPEDFFTWVDGKKVPDLALIQVILNEASSKTWRYVIGDWLSGWRLTKRGLRFAKDVERRALAKGH
jgi:hypothetical protein